VTDAHDAVLDDDAVLGGAVPSDDLLDALNRPSVYVRDGVAFYRASSLGRCTKALIAQRQEYTTMDPPADMRQRWDEGHLHEPDILRRLVTQFDFAIRNPQAEIAIRLGTGVVVLGHVDTLAVHGPGTFMGGRELVVDAKTAASSAMKTWRTFPGSDDVAGQREWLMKHYYGYWWQGGVYLAAPEHRDMDYAFAVKDKESGQIEVWGVHREVFPTMGMIVKRVMDIEKEAATGVLPIACDIDDYPCPVFYLHDQSAGRRPKTEKLSDEVKARRQEVLGARYRDLKDREAATKRELGEVRAQIVEEGFVGTKTDDFTISPTTSTSVVTDWLSIAHTLGLTVDEAKAKFQRKAKTDTFRVTDNRQKAMDDKAAAMRVE